MLYAAPGREDRVLALAAAVESARPEWFAATPAVHVVDSKEAA